MPRPVMCDPRLCAQGPSPEPCTGVTDCSDSKLDKCICMHVPVLLEIYVVLFLAFPINEI